MAFLATEAAPCESDSEPGGKERDDVRVDHSTLQMIAHIFPASTLGQVFFARFLERAASEKSIIPDVARDEVYICTKSIATLGKELGLSNDTAQKYVVLYKALGLLQKRKVMDQLVFVLSTGIYHPPENLEANLDYLIQKSRPKLRTMASDVKVRCQVYGLLSQDIIVSIQQLNSLLQAQKGDSKHSLEQRMAQGQQMLNRLLGQLMTAHLPQGPTQVDSSRSLPTKQGREQAKKANESTRSLGPDRHKLEEPLQNLPPVMPGVDTRQAKQDVESTQSDTAGRHSSGMAPLNLPGEAHGVDEGPARHEMESTQSDISGRRSIEKDTVNLPEVAHQVDSRQTRRGIESTQNGIPGRRSIKKDTVNLPDMLHQVDSKQVRREEEQAIESTRGEELGRFEEDHIHQNLPNLPGKGDSGDASRNVYVNSIYNFIKTYTLREPRRVAEFFAEQFEGDRRVYPKYLKLFHTQDGRDRDPHILAAAFICTMVRLHCYKWNISSHPGGFFTKRCREYDVEIPEEVEGWIESYGHISPIDLLEVLAEQVQPIQASTSITPTAVPYHKPAPVPLLPPLRLDASVRMELGRMVMSKSEAQALVETITHDDRTRLLRARCIRLGKETARYAVLVDASAPGSPPRQTVVYSADEWQVRLDTMKTWRDLIYPAASPQTQEGGSNQ